MKTHSIKDWNALVGRKIKAKRDGLTVAGTLLSPIAWWRIESDETTVHVWQDGWTATLVEEPKPVAKPARPRRKMARAAASA